MLTRRQFGMTLGMALPDLCSASFPAWSRTEMTSGDAAAELRHIEGATGGRLGVVVVDTGSNRRIEHRANERFPLCSTGKALSCGALLAKVDSGRESLDRRIRFSASNLVTYSPVSKDRIGGDGMTLAEICAAAMTISDNTAANLIVASLGGPSAVTTFVRSIGDQATRLDRTETALNEATPGDPRDTTTPSAMVATLGTLILGDALSTASRGRLVGWLVANKTGDAKLRAGVPTSWRVGDKTGSGGHGSSNDVAVLWRPGKAPLVAAVYLTGAAHITEPARSAAIAAVGKVAASALET